MDANMRKLVGGLQPLSALSPARLDGLLSLCSVEQVDRGATLFRAGDKDDYVVYVLSGTVKLSAAGSGKAPEYSIIGGSAEAAYPIADIQPREVTAVAEGPVQVLRIPNNTLDGTINTEQVAQAKSDAQAKMGSGKPAGGGWFGKLAGRLGVKKEDKAAPTSDWQAVVRQTEVFKMVPAEKVEALLSRFQPMSAAGGEVIVKQGDEGDYYYLIVSGTASVLRQMDGYAEAVPVAELKPGTGFGEDALISNSKRNATVAMKEAGTLVRLSKNDFDELMKEHVVLWLSRPEAQKKVSEGGKWLDVRHTAEFTRSRLPDAISMPLHEVRRRAPELDKATLYICYCQNGRLSSTAAFILRQLGYHAAVLRGGVRHLEQG